MPSLSKKDESLAFEGLVCDLISCFIFLCVFGMVVE
jgi:hypothetical protein